MRTEQSTPNSGWPGESSSVGAIQKGLFLCLKIYCILPFFEGVQPRGEVPAKQGPAWAWFSMPMATCVQTPILPWKTLVSDSWYLVQAGGESNQPQPPFQQVPVL